MGSTGFEVTMRRRLRDSVRGAEEHELHEEHEM